MACLPDTAKWHVTAADVAQRKDYRRHRVFSIDPPTAKVCTGGLIMCAASLTDVQDLDDALSVERLDNGLLRIGVHIADVSHFVTPGTALDEEAERRGTSVYLVEKVIPMLPPLLCEQLCR